MRLKSKRKIQELKEGKFYFLVEYIFNRLQFWDIIVARNLLEVEDVFYNELYTRDSKITKKENLGVLGKREIKNYIKEKIKENE